MPSRIAAAVLPPLVFLTALITPLISLVLYLPVPPGVGRIVLIAVAGVLTPMMIFGRDAAFLNDAGIARIFYRMGLVTVVLFLNLFMASVVHFLLRGALALADVNIPGRITFLPIAAAALAHVGWGLVNARSLARRRIVVDGSAYPASWAGRRIVFFSDNHYGTLNGPRLARRLVETVMQEKPDLILCGGDLFDGPGGEVAETVQELRKLHAPLGVYAVLGNHDYFYLTIPGSSRELLGRQRRRESMPLEGSRLRDIQSRLNWRFLENEAVTIDGLVLAGLLPFSREDEERARRFLGELETNKPTILLNHKPEMVDEAQTAGVNLQLSGHYHGGPVFPVNIIMKWILRGRHHRTTCHEGLTLDTSSGSGLSFWYPRTSGRHELVIVEFGETHECRED